LKTTELNAFITITNQRAIGEQRAKCGQWSLIGRSRSWATKKCYSQRSEESFISLEQ